jgi:hypothetical protein
MPPDVPSTAARRQSREKKNTSNIPEGSIDHQSQFPDTPLLATISVTARGVSAENVVATIAVPASHHGIERCDRK